MTKVVTLYYKFINSEYLPMGYRVKAQKTFRIFTFKSTKKVLFSYTEVTTILSNLLNFNTNLYIKTIINKIYLNSP